MTARKRTRPRTTFFSVLIVLVAVAGLGWYGGGDWLSEQITGESGQATAGPPDTSAGGAGGADTAREQLAELAVAEWASMRGYSRDRFSHWRSVDGCDARQTVLERDGENVTMDEDCRAVSGSWFSPYDGQTLTDPSDVDIDHTVPLANAWRTGAADWDDERRADFANDLDRPQLLAVSASSNRAKGDQDPSQWKPPQRDYWCQYAQDWIEVKYYWELWVTEAERDALADMLDTC